MQGECQDLSTDNRRKTQTCRRRQGQRLAMPGIQDTGGSRRGNHSRHRAGTPAPAFLFSIPATTWLRGQAWLRSQSSKLPGRVRMLANTGLCIVFIFMSTASCRHSAYQGHACGAGAVAAAAGGGRGGGPGSCSSDWPGCEAGAGAGAEPAAAAGAGCPLTRTTSLLAPHCTCGQAALRLRRALSHWTSWTACRTPQTMISVSINRRQFEGFESQCRSARDFAGGDLTW